MSNDNRFKLTNATIKSRCLPPSPGDTRASGRPVLEKFYWDTEIRGFGIVVRPVPEDADATRRAQGPTRSFIVQKDVRGRCVRVTLGRLGEITLEHARDLAQDAAHEMRKGVNPNQRKREEAARGTTLADAIEWHQARMRARECAERSVVELHRELSLHVSDWLARPLAEIKRNDCIARHERISKRAGRYAANRVFRNLRACYNTAADRLADTEALPPNPVTRKFPFNRERRRREPIAWADFPSWVERVDAIGNPVRRDLQLFILFTGLRATDAKTVRWEELNLGTTPKLRGRVEIPPGCMHRPRPKGGVDRAFTVPLSAYVLDLLRRREAENPMVFGNDDGWVFPTRDMKGAITHVQEIKEQRAGAAGAKLPSPHRLRDTFASASFEAGLHPLDLKVLMNHVVSDSGNVTEGYIRPSVEHLRSAVERVSAFLRARMHPAPNLRAGEPPAEPVREGETA